jgi:hypothetical protein
VTEIEVILYDDRTAAVTTYGIVDLGHRVYDSRKWLDEEQTYALTAILRAVGIPLVCDPQRISDAVRQLNDERAAAVHRRPV